MDWSARILVIADGALPSLVACIAAREATLAAGSADESAPAPPRPVCFIPPGLSPAHHAAARTMADTYGLEILDPEPPTPDAIAAPSNHPAARLDESGLLIAAGFAAALRGCAQVLWPAFVGNAAVGAGSPDLTEVSRLLDKALLAGRLCAIDAEVHARPDLRIDCPYADLTDDQLADLARDLDARPELCWWWADDSPAAAAQRDRWHAAFARIGSPLAARSSATA